MPYIPVDSLSDVVYRLVVDQYDPPPDYQLGFWATLPLTTFIDVIFAQQVKDGQISRKNQVALRSSLYKELFQDTLEKEEQKEWEELAAEEHKNVCNAIDAKMNAPPPTDAAERQQIINRLPAFAQPILDLMAEYTGWKMTLVAGGPEPADNGRLNVVSIHSGVVKGTIKQNFGQSEWRLYKEFVVPVFAHFLKKCYTLEECRASALPADTEGLTVALNNTSDVNHDTLDWNQEYLRVIGPHVRLSSAGATSVSGSDSSNSTRESSPSSSTTSSGDSSTSDDDDARPRKQPPVISSSKASKKIRGLEKRKVNGTLTPDVRSQSSDMDEADDEPSNSINTAFKIGPPLRARPHPRPKISAHLSMVEDSSDIPAPNPSGSLETVGETGELTASAALATVRPGLPEIDSLVTTLLPLDLIEPVLKELKTFGRIEYTSTLSNDGGLSTVSAPGLTSRNILHASQPPSPTVLSASILEIMPASSQTKHVMRVIPVDTSRRSEHTSPIPSRAGTPEDSSIGFHPPHHASLCAGNPAIFPLQSPDASPARSSVSTAKIPPPYSPPPSPIPSRVGTPENSPSAFQSQLSPHVNPNDSEKGLIPAKQLDIMTGFSVEVNPDDKELDDEDPNSIISKVTEEDDEDDVAPNLTGAISSPHRRLSSRVAQKRARSPTIDTTMVTSTEKRLRASSNAAVLEYEIPRGNVVAKNTRKGKAAWAVQKKSGVTRGETSTASTSPKYYTQALATFNSTTLGARWDSLVAAWSAFEIASQYISTDLLGLHSRPAGIHDWIHRAQKPTYRPDLSRSKLVCFQTEFGIWWRSLQPDWRVDGDSNLVRDDDEDLEGLRRAGPKGLTSIVAGLFFWGDAIRENCNQAQRVLWEEMLNDVEWVLLSLNPSSEAA
ncbi:hypothetical protein CPB83DRAFT_899379 [Crepidotus variabilis]|uniref:Uncharacterized protein n=1 Tax=Crepidotus variabilis TaxID=179855 RepID=A0A9P6JJ83_9AGAR|nr:hypothetical protein CPB83DRAFT_899379 [Crepidotus variabilis]